jgi:hypothetical protein
MGGTVSYSWRLDKCRPKISAILAFSLLVLMASSGYAAEVRVRNDSNNDFTSVVVGKVKYGDIKTGATTSYQYWPDEVYNIERCTLFANAIPMKFQPRDYNGEWPLLGAGKFTYVLTIVNGQLSIRAEDDPT